MKKIEWEKSDDVVCSKCRGPLTIPYAHIHFHYGTEGLSEKAINQLVGLVGEGHGDDVGPLGQNMCMGCFCELIELIAGWKETSER